MKSISIALSLIFLASNAWSNTVFVDQVSGPKNAAPAFQALIKSEAELNGYQLVRELQNADYVLKGKIIELGQAYVITLSKQSTTDSESFSQKAKIRQIEELDSVTESLTRAVLKSKSMKKKDQVTEDQMNEEIQMKTVTRQFYAGFGTAASHGLGDSNRGFHWAAGYIFGLDPQFGLRLHFDDTNLNNSRGGSTFAGVGAQYYFTRDQHAPYALGLIGFSTAKTFLRNPSTIERENGWGLQAGLGMQFFRTTALNFAVEATYTTSMYKFSSTGRTPGNFGLRLVFFW